MSDYFLTCKTFKSRVGLSQELAPSGFHGVLDHLDRYSHEQNPWQGLDEMAANPLGHPVG